MNCPYNILVFETLEAAKTVADLAAAEEPVAALSMGTTKTELAAQKYLADYWKQKLNCSIQVLAIGETFSVATENAVEKTDNHYKQICVKLDKDGTVGWINCSKKVCPEAF